MLTFKAEVLKSQRKVDGTYNVKIRTTYNREVKRLSTNIFVRKEDLTKSFKLKNPKFIQKADAVVRYYQEMCVKLPLYANDHSMNDIMAYLHREQKSRNNRLQVRYPMQQLKGLEITQQPSMPLWSFWVKRN